MRREALAQRSDTVEVFARRGSILDRNGNVLVRSLPSESVYAVPREIVDPDAAAAKLERSSASSIPRRSRRCTTGICGSFGSRARYRTTWPQRVRAPRHCRHRLKGRGDGSARRHRGRLASTVLGFVGTDENGLDGVEYAYDDVLRGHSGRVTLEADEFGRPIPFGRERVVAPAQPGSTSS